MAYIQQILFVVAVVITGFYVTKRVKLIARAIQLGRPEDRSANPGERLKTMLLVAFGQKKMFTNLLVGSMHFVIYAGFIIINLEILEIILDGVLGTHRLFAPVIAPIYPYLINFFEILAFGVLAVCVVFLSRRYIGGVQRLQPDRNRELRGWPKFDATTILVAEIVLMIAFLTWNAADTVLRDRGVGHYGELKGMIPDFLISQILKPVFAGFSDSGLEIYERSAWWLHILGILAFAVYVTYSKHLHIALGFSNVYFSDLKPKGEMANMPAVTKEVQLMLGLPTTETTASHDQNGQQPADDSPETIGRFGAKDVEDLTWINLMNAYSCTECGRCTAACPANITGKKLSPRKIMMDTRDRLEDIERGWAKNGNDYKDDKSLLGDYISVEEINACTTCQACVEACPININPLDIIVQLRRYKVMEESQAPGSWNAMFSNVENNMAPWKFSPSDRFNWAEQVNEVK